MISYVGHLFLESEVLERKLLECQFLNYFSMVVDFISFLTVYNQYLLQRLVYNENNCRRVFLEIWYKYQQRRHNTFATSLEPQVSILAHADWRSRTSLESGAATGVASITTKHNHNNKINLPNYRFWSYEIKCALQYVLLAREFFWYSNLRVGSIFTIKI